MFVPVLRNALFAFALGLGGGALIAAEAPTPVRPQITSLTIALEDGRSYSLSTEQLQAPKGGAIFWGDWAVINLLLPQYSFRPLNFVNAERVLRLWFTPGPSGQLPAFLVNTPQGPIYPLAEAAPQGWIAPRYSRPRVAHIAVGYADGRCLSLSEFALRDPKSGVMVWTDFAVANLLIPFYRNARHLPTQPEDVMRIWHQSGFAPARTFLPENQELPGFLVKPACIPSYPGPENAQ